LEAPVISQTSFPSSAFQSPEEVEEVTEDEIRDELYCIMTTTVVGIQYYKG
jgi:SWI/SNF-related matrix-associated actin-dependent regulator of chromatin subfamily A3